MGSERCRQPRTAQTLTRRLAWTAAGMIDLQHSRSHGARDETSDDHAYKPEDRLKHGHSLPGAPEESAAAAQRDRNVAGQGRYPVGTFRPSKLGESPAVAGDS